MVKKYSKKNIQSKWWFGLLKYKYLILCIFGLLTFLVLMDNESSKEKLLDSDRMKSSTFGEIEGKPSHESGNIQHAYNIKEQYLESLIETKPHAGNILDHRTIAANMLAMMQTEISNLSRQEEDIASTPVVWVNPDIPPDTPLSQTSKIYGTIQGLDQSITITLYKGSSKNIVPTRFAEVYLKKQKNFIFEKLLSGAYILKATSYGLPMQEKEIILTEGADQNIQFVFDNYSCISGVVRHLEQGIKNVQISLYNGHQLIAQYMTKENGNFNFGSLDQYLNYRLYFSATGYTFEAPEIDVSVPTHQLMVEAKPLDKLSGIVLNEFGKPIHQFKVQLEYVGERLSYSFQPFNNENGRFEIPLPKTGTIKINAQSNGFGESSSEIVTLRSNTTQGEFVITLKKGYSVHGRAFDQNGQAISGLGIFDVPFDFKGGTYYRDQTPLFVTLEDGVFDVPHISEDISHLYFFHSEYVIRKISLDAVDVGQELRVIMTKNAIVEGFVIDADNNPIDRQLVTASCGDSRDYHNTYSDNVGYYRIPFLKPASWTIAADIKTSQYIRYIQQKVKLEPGITQKVDLVIEPDEKSISGMVTYLGQSLASGKLCFEQFLDGKELSTSVKIYQGHYESEKLKNGLYFMHVHLYEQGKYYSVPDPIDLMKLEEPIVNVNIHGAGVVGVLLNTNGMPVPKVSVKARSLDPNRSPQNNHGSAYSDQYGYFYIPGLAAGQHQITITDKKFALKKFDIELLEGEKLDLGSITLENGFLLSGFIRTLDGQTIQASIMAHEAKTMTLKAKALSEKNGTYALPSLDTGSYYITVTSPNYFTDTQLIVIDKDQTYSIQLGPCGMKVLLLKDKAGESLLDYSVQILSSDFSSFSPLNIIRSNLEGSCSIPTLYKQGTIFMIRKGEKIMKYPCPSIGAWDEVLELNFQPEQSSP